MGKDLCLFSNITENGEHHRTYQQVRDQILNENQAAEYLNLSVKTLQAWRFQCKGPRYSKLGRLVRYRKTDLDAYWDSYCVDPLA